MWVSHSVPIREGTFTTVARLNNRTLPHTRHCRLRDSITPGWIGRQGVEGSVTSLTVFCFCTYRTRKTNNWTDRDFAAFKFIKAIKGESLSGWADIPVGPAEWAHLDASNASEASDIFGRMAVTRVDWPTFGPVALVPIPHSRCTVFAQNAPKTRLLADALVKYAANADVTVADVLRWSEPMGAAHASMSRRYPEQLYPFLRLVRTLPAKRGVVLVDDMLTTGGPDARSRCVSCSAGCNRLGRTVRRTLGCEFDDQ